MGFSELWRICDDIGLERYEDDLYIYGNLCGYPVYLKDDPENREYLLTIFLTVPLSVNAELVEGMNILLEKLPKNAVKERKNEYKYQQIRLHAGLLYQENLPLLSEFIKKLCFFAEKLSLSPSPPDKAIAIPPKEKTSSKSSEKSEKPINGFDKYSLLGLFTALIGGFASMILASIISNSRPTNIGGMLSSWAPGAVIALIVLGNYAVFAKKIDVFGTICCSVITAMYCFFAGYITILRVLTEKMKILDPLITIKDTMKNRSYYQLLMPMATSDFSIVLIKNFFIAIAVSAIFYMIYFKKRRELMY